MAGPQVVPAGGAVQEAGLYVGAGRDASGSLAGATPVTGAGELSEVWPAAPPTTPTAPAVSEPPPPVKSRPLELFELSWTWQLAALTLKDPCNSIVSAAVGFNPNKQLVLVAPLKATARAVTVIEVKPRSFIKNTGSTCETIAST